MKLNEYQNRAARTINTAKTTQQLTNHALHGMAAEVGEIHGIYQKAHQGHEIDPEELKKEVGDVLWMIAEYCTVQGWTLEEVAQANIDKLLGRYPNGFEENRSINREE